MGDERQEWSRGDPSLPAPLLVVDHDAFVVPDLVTGQAYRIELADLLDLLADAADRVEDGPLQPKPVPRRGVEGGATDQLQLVTPTVLRLYGGRALAWDSAQSSYVPLDVVHLEAVDELHRARRDDGDPRAPGRSSASDDVLADLLELGVVSRPGDGGGASTSVNGPNAAAAAVQEVMVELGRRAPDADGAADRSSVESVEPDVQTELPVGLGTTVPTSTALRVRRLAGRSLRLGVRVARRGVVMVRDRRTRTAGAGEEPVGSGAAPERPTVTADGQVTQAGPAAVEPDVIEPAAVEDAAAEHDEGRSPEGDMVDLAAPIADEAEEAEELDLGLDDRVPVIALYSWGTVSQDCGQLSDEVEPVLSIGMLMAHARSCRDGALNELYDFVRIRPDSTQVLAAWARDPRPAIFLFSDYLWNVDQHLEWSRIVKELSPESLCIHGGPSCPKYEQDAADFVTSNPGVDLAVRGEGELVFEQLLVELDGDIDPMRLDRLTGVGSLTYVDHTGAVPRVVRTEDAARPEHLDEFPSPYLSGEFDDLLSVPWRSASIETNRGCPYGCTFCDWGSATLSRIRKFDLDRVRAELDWVMERATPPDIMLTDANFGIFSRDLDVAEHLAELRRQYHLPYTVTISGMAKNTVKHSVPIIQTLVRAGIGPIAAQSVQSTDEATLEAIRRHNIKLDRFDDMARAFKELGLPLVTDILMGLPGSTVESFKNDLQDCLDREVTARTMEILMLPNSPMNDPEYRAEWAVEADEFGVVCASSTFSRADYDQMKRLRLLYRALDHFGLLRHVLRHLQWEHGLRSLDVIHDIDRAIVEDPLRYPLLGFVGRVFDMYTVPPVAWEPFFDEVVQFLSDRYDIELDPALSTVLGVQRFVLPARGRRFPDTVELAHDYVAYRRDRTSLAEGEAPRRLADYGPGRLTVDDPNAVCVRYIQRNEMPDRRDHTTSNLFWVGYDWELESPLMRHLVTNVTKLDVVV